MPSPQDTSDYPRPASAQSASPPYKSAAIDSLGTGSLGDEKNGKDIEGQMAEAGNEKTGWYEKYHVRHITRAFLFCLFTG